jgi:hypothetical protein
MSAGAEQFRCAAVEDPFASKRFAFANLPVSVRVSFKIESGYPGSFLTVNKDV